MIYQKIILAAFLFVFINCSSSNVGNNDRGKIKDNNLVNHETRGLHYEAHKYRLSQVFGLGSGSETFAILETSQTFLKSQILDAKSFSALIKIYAKACEEVSLERINHDMGYKTIHELITGVSISEEASLKVQADINALYAQEDNANDLNSFAYCLRASTSKDAVLLNIVVANDEEGD